jgi:hypothetical protein
LQNLVPVKFVTTMSKAGSATFESDFCVSRTDTKNRHGEGKVALPTTVNDDALALSTDLAQAGVVFNDATRLTDGGLWSSPADDNNQLNYVGMYTTDLHTVSDDIAAMLADLAAINWRGSPHSLQRPTRRP